MTRPGLLPFGGGRVKRRLADLYPTHPAGTEALVRVEGERLRECPVILEPACGPGMIAKLLEGHGFAVAATDLHDHGFGRPGLDFLTFARGDVPVDAGLVTNPPYGDGLAEAFIRHAVTGLGLPYVAMLLKATFWHADGRRALFETCKPARIHPLGWRLDWSGKGSPPEEHSWNIWEGGPAKHCEVMPSLPRPLLYPDVGWDAWVSRRGEA